MTDQHENPVRQAIADAIAQNDVILFMKGTPDAPACGFSARTVGMLQSLDTRFAAEHFFFREGSRASSLFFGSETVFRK